MGIEAGNKLEQQENAVKKVELTQEEAQKKGEQTHEQIVKIKIQEQVEEKLDSFGVSKEEQKDIIDKISQLNESDRQDFIESLNSSENKEELYKNIGNLIKNNEQEDINNYINNNNTETENNNTETENNNYKNLVNLLKISNNPKLQNQTEFIGILRNYSTQIELNIQEIAKSREKLKELENIKTNENNQINGLKKYIENLQKEINEQYKKLYEDLKQALTPDKLQQIATELGPNTREFQEFKNSLIGLEGTNGSYFKTQFDMLERVGPKNASEFVKLGIDSGKIKTDSAGNTISQNGETNIIFDKNGNRTLSLKDSNYKLNSNIDTTKELTQIGEIEAKAQKEFNEINDKINDLNSLKNIIIEYQNLDFEGLKIMLLANVDKFEKAGISRSVIENAEDSQTLLQNLDLVIAEKQKELQEQKDKKTKEIQKEIGEIIARNKEKARQVDENKKEMLDFLRETGFDLIPQSISDNILQFINNNSEIKQKLGILYNIDLSKGDFGLDRNGSKITRAEKEIFVKLLNKMLTGKLTGTENGAFKIGDTGRVELKVNGQGNYIVEKHKFFNQALA